MEGKIMDTIPYFEAMLAQRKAAIGTEKKSYSNAEWCCANAYEYSKLANSNILIFRETIWKDDVKAIGQSLLNNKICKFCISCCGTSLLELLAEFENNDWHIEKIITVPEYEPYTNTSNNCPAIQLFYM